MKDIIGFLNDKVPDKKYNDEFTHKIFRFTDPNTNKILNNFLSEEKETKDLIKENLIDLLINQEKEIKCKLSEYQLYFLKNLIFQIIDNKEICDLLYFPNYIFETDKIIK